jgi:UDP-N-acetylmuramate--alanine ligase
VLAEAGREPAAFVGALLPAALTGGTPATARMGSGSTFVVEADEYAGNFDSYFPDIALVTTVEWDHPDVFADRAATIDAFVAWLDRVPAAGLVANLGDDGVVDMLTMLDAGSARTGPVVGTSLATDSGSAQPGTPTSALVIDRRLQGLIAQRSPDGIALDVAGSIGSARRVHLPIAGDHNASNALVALAAAIEILGAGANVDRLLLALASFPGIGRRLERKGEARGVVVYDDYGHHPTAIRATIAAIRQREPGRRIWAVYEPLTFHRTAALLHEFADSLADADAVAIANIWASRDPDTTVASPEGLADAVRALRPEIEVAAPGSVEDTAAWLARNVRDGDAVLVMGGGRSYRIGELVLEHLESS